MLESQLNTNIQKSNYLKLICLNSRELEFVLDLFF